MKEVLRSALVLFVKAGAIPFALYIGITLAKPLTKLGRTAFKLGGRATAPILGGAKNVGGWVANKGSQSGNRWARLGARVATGTIGPGGSRRMAVQGAAYFENRKKQDEAIRNYVLNRGGAIDARPGSRRADDIIAGLQGMKMEDVPTLRAGTIKGLLQHSDPRVAEAARDLFHRAVQSSSVQARLTADQLKAIETPPTSGPTAVVPPVVSPGVTFPTRKPGAARVMGRRVLRQVGRRPGWPNPMS